MGLPAAGSEARGALAECVADAGRPEFARSCQTKVMLGPEVNLGWRMARVAWTGPWARGCSGLEVDEGSFV